QLKLARERQGLVQLGHRVPPKMEGGQPRSGAALPWRIAQGWPWGAAARRRSQPERRRTTKPHAPDPITRTGLARAGGGGAMLAPPARGGGPGRTSAVAAERAPQPAS